MVPPHATGSQLVAPAAQAAGFIGAVVEPIDRERSRHFGGCFALSDPDLFVTADHVVAFAYSEGAKRLHVLGPDLEPTPVEAVFRHPRQDIAVLRAPRADIDPFSRVDDPAPGEPVRLFAYNAGGGQQMATRVGRFGRKRDARYSFDAFELDDAPSKAFSGTPVMSADGAALGVFTQIGRQAGREFGVALRLCSSEWWLQRIVREECAA